MHVSVCTCLYYFFNHGLSIMDFIFIWIVIRLQIGMFLQQNYNIPVSVFLICTLLSYFVFLFVQKCMYLCVCFCIMYVWRWRWAGCRGLLLLNRSSMLLIKMHSIPLWMSVSLIIKQCSAHQIWELAASVVMLPTYYCYNYQVPVILLVSHLP